MKQVFLTLIFLTLLGTGGFTRAQDLQTFEQRTTVHVLDNGWTFIIVQHPEAPVFSFFTYANVGSAQEVPGITGLAHMFEHMAFKGTRDIGTTDYRKERQALDAMEAAYQAWQAERLAPDSDPKRLESLQTAFEQKQAEAEKFVKSNEFGDIVNREGGVDLNAFTNSDFTGYFYSLPANKLELFAYLESERFLHPVFREFYKERAVVQEERRMRTESNPIGRLIEQFVATAFIAHPYKHPTVGYMSDLRSITLTDARRFFNEHYGPSNLVTAVVGDVDTQQTIKLIDQYFGRIPRRPDEPPLRTVEPPQPAEKILDLQDPSQPVYLEGYHKPAETASDQPVWDAIDDIFSSGRTSRLYRRLVRDDRIAVSIGSFSSFPGSKYPALWIAYSFPAKGHTDEQVRDAIRDEIKKLKTQPVTDEELARFKTRARADLIRSLADDEGLAQRLAYYQTLYGDWRELFHYLDRIEAVTKEDIMRVADSTLTESNRTVGYIHTAQQH